MSEENEELIDYSDFNIAELAQEMKDIRADLDERKSEATKLQKEYDRIRLHLLPDKMEEAGYDSIKLKGIGRLTITGDIYAGMVSDHKEEALEWLESEGHGDLIKPTIHSSTLKAFLKEQINNGEEIPSELFNVMPFSRASITKA